MERLSLKYSIIFLCYDPENKKSFKYKSLWSIIENSVDFNYEIIFVKDIKGYPNAVNYGLGKARGEYIVVVSDDVFIKDKLWLYKLTKENCIVSYASQIFHLTGEVFPSGALYGFSRDVYNRMGNMDTQYADGYGFDEIDHFISAKNVGVQFHIEPFKVKHLGNKTYQLYWKETKEDMTSQNHFKFVTKWQQN